MFSILTTFLFFREVNYECTKNEIKKKLNYKYEKYRIHENLIIARQARKTIRYIEKNTINFPTQYKVLRDKIIGCSYSILENIYRANIFQDINNKKEIVVQMQMLNFYLEEGLRKNLLNNKKFESYVNHLIDIDKMIRAWFSYETCK